MACGAPQPVKFRAAQFKVGAGNVGCGGGGAGARRCLAAVHPFLFVGTTNGVVAYGIADPTSTAPTPIPVGGVPFVPQHVVASGSRVYFVGPVAGSGPYKVAIAWLTVPPDPFTTKLLASSAFVSVAQSSIDTVLAGPKGGLFLVQQNAMAAFPAARAAAPLADLGTLDFFPSPGIPSGATVVTASEERLVTRRVVTNMGVPYAQLFSFENGAGTAGAQNGGEQNVATAMAAYPPEHFAQGPGGAVAWHASGVVYPDGGGANVQSTRVSWLVESGTATTFAAQPKVEVETYPFAQGLGSDLAGPLAFLDADRLLVLSAAATNTAQTAVQLVTRTPMPAVVPNRRFVLPFAPSALAAAASGPYGYVLTPEPSLGAGPQVHVFAAGCDN
jgi:hypothetical protein